MKGFQGVARAEGYEPFAKRIGAWAKECPGHEARWSRATGALSKDRTNKVFPKQEFVKGTGCMRPLIVRRSK